jgi:hypothetical protein
MLRLNIWCFFYFILIDVNILNYCGVIVLGFLDFWIHICGLKVLMYLTFEIQFVMYGFTLKN